MSKAMKIITSIFMVVIMVVSSQAAIIAYAADGAHLVSKSDSTCLGSDGTMDTAITLGDNLVQGSISTDVISDMSISGKCWYMDHYNMHVDAKFEGARDQDYSCVAFISKSNTVFKWAGVEFTAYDNDGARAHQQYELSN